MNYVAPFEAVRECFTVSQFPPREEAVAGSYDSFLAALQLLLAGIDVDEDWYVAQYPDILQAIAAGTTESAKQHFVEHGYFEGRLPFPIAVDEQWYLSQNLDVCENVRNGIVESGQRHFETDGYREGRLPFALDGSLSRRKAGRPLRLVA